MFEIRKKYDSKCFVIIRKEKILKNIAFRPRPNLPWSTFNYTIRTTFDGADNYSLAYKIDDVYLDLFDLNTYKIFNAFECNIGELVVTEEKKLNDLRMKLTCSEAIDLFVSSEYYALSSLIRYNEKEIIDFKRKAIHTLKKV